MKQALSKFLFVVSAVLRNLRDANKAITLEKKIAEQAGMIEGLKAEFMKLVDNRNEWRERAGNYRALLLGTIRSHGLNANYVTFNRKDVMIEGSHWSLDIKDDGDRVRLRIKELRERKYVKTADQAREEERQRLQGGTRKVQRDEDTPTDGAVSKVPQDGDGRGLAGRLGRGDVREVSDAVEQDDRQEGDGEGSGRSSAGVGKVLADHPDYAGKIGRP